jgi:hypothetical protein
LGGHRIKGVQLTRTGEIFYSWCLAGLLAFAFFAGIRVFAVIVVKISEILG